MPCKGSDPVRSVGHVTIQFTYLEDEIDKRANQICQHFGIPKRQQPSWQFSVRVKWLKEWFRKAFDSYPYAGSTRDRVSVDEVLDGCLQAATHRNDLVHQPILSDRKGGIRQKPRDGELRSLNISEIDGLIQEVVDLHGAVSGLLEQLIGDLRRSRDQATEQ
jgi:hypothetical protein